MKARPIIALLLALAIAQAAITRPASAQEESPQAEAEELKLTPEEEREVRDIAARFEERWQATHNFGQIIDEMFVKDFTERLWRGPSSQLPWVFLNENLVAYTAGDVLRRFYVASMNFYGLFFRLAEIVEYQKKQSGNEEGELALDALSPEIVDVLLGDPTLATVVEILKKDDEDARAQKVEGHQPAENVDSPPPAGATPETNDEDAKETDEIGLIKNPLQLNGVTTTFEKAVELMRKRLASMPPLQPPTPSSEETQSQPPSHEIDVENLNETEYGYPKGTRVASIKVLSFYVSLVRIDGHFKILTVAIYVD
jgi:hypothetical protein